MKLQVDKKKLHRKMTKSLQYMTLKVPIFEMKIYFLNTFEKYLLSITIPYFSTNNLFENFRNYLEKKKEIVMKLVFLDN